MTPNKHNSSHNSNTATSSSAAAAAAAVAPGESSSSSSSSSSSPSLPFSNSFSLPNVSSDKNGGGPAAPTDSGPTSLLSPPHSSMGFPPPLQRMLTDVKHLWKDTGASHEMGDFASSMFPSGSGGSVGDTVSKYLSTPMERMTETMQHYMNAVTLGAVLGAAVATGICLGVVVMVRAFPSMVSGNSTSNSTASTQSRRWSWAEALSNEWFSRWWRRRTIGGRRRFHNTPKSNESKSPVPCDKVAILSETIPRIVLIRGDGFPANAVLEENAATQNDKEWQWQCHVCIRQVSSLLKSVDMTWNDNVRRITAFVVEKDAASSSPVRQYLQQDLETEKVEASQIMMTIVFVQRLEHEKALVQLEVMASSSSSSSPIQ